jgi:hypothetical protein
VTAHPASDRATPTRRTTATLSTGGERRDTGGRRPGGLAGDAELMRRL